MRSKLLRMAMLMVVSMWLMQTALLAAQNSTASNPDEQKFAGTWVGSYVTEGGVTERLSYVLRKDEKGQWHGTIKFTNQDGEQIADFKTLLIADGKMKGRIEAPDAEVTIEGQFQGDHLEGTYSVVAAGSTDIVDKGTWKVTRSAAAKTGQ
ncbi:MAG: hypothetical protein V7641_4110 [Blastocatellia bacterium]